MGPKRKSKTIAVDEVEHTMTIPQKKRDYKQSRKSKYSSAQAYTTDTVSGYKKAKLSKNNSNAIKTEQSEADEIIEADLGDNIEADEVADDKSDCKFKLNHTVTVFITLPTGDEEVIPDYQLSFTDKSGGFPEFDENIKKAMEDEEDQQRVVSINNIEWEFKLQKLVNHIKKQGYPVENSFVNYYSSDFQVQVNCGADPISQAITICPSDIEENPYTKELSIHLVFTRGYKEDIEQVEKLMHNENLTPDLIALQRNKERSIGFIIEKVTQWRKLYNGFYDENHELKRMSLEQAATEVGVSKKSLDDYLSQIRQGRTNGFDFNRNKHQKVGKLRTFNKEIKKQLDVLKK